MMFSICEQIMDRIRYTITNNKMIYVIIYAPQSLWTVHLVKGQRLIYFRKGFTFYLATTVAFSIKITCKLHLTLLFYFFLVRLPEVVSHSLRPGLLNGCSALKARGMGGGVLVSAELVGGSDTFGVVISISGML